MTYHVRTDAGFTVQQLADQLWQEMPATANAENTITLPAPLVIGVLQILRRLQDR